VPFTFVATVAAICYTGAHPVFVDIDPRSFTMDVTADRARLTPGPKDPAVTLRPAGRHGSILAIARKHGLLVIEDAAQAHGAEYNGQSVGSLGTLGCFSSIPEKISALTVKGGIVVTSDAKRADMLRMLPRRRPGAKYHHVVLATTTHGGIARRHPPREARHLMRGRKGVAAGAVEYEPLFEERTSCGRSRCRTRVTSITSTPCAPPIAPSCSARCRPTACDRNSLSDPRHLAGRLSDLATSRANFPDRACSARVLAADVSRLSNIQVEFVSAAVHHNVHNSTPSKVNGSHRIAAPCTAAKTSDGSGFEVDSRGRCAQYGYQGLIELYARFALGEGHLDVLMRRAIWRAPPVRSVTPRHRPGAGFKHLVAPRSATRVHRRADIHPGPVPDGTCIIGNHVWMGRRPTRPRDLILGDYSRWGPGAKVLGSTHTACRSTSRSVQTDLEIKPRSHRRVADVGMTPSCCGHHRRPGAAIVGAGGW